MAEYIEHNIQQNEDGSYTIMVTVEKGGEGR